MQLPHDMEAAVRASPELPTPLPPDPFPLFAAWWASARDSKRVPNPDAMTLATVDADGTPSARVVLCRGVQVGDGYVTFFTNYHGRKGRALAANPAAAACFHFDHDDRQVRIEGLTVKSPAPESDAYFRSRRWESRLSAWTSRQSEPTAGREELLERMGEVLAELKLDAAEIVRLGNAAEIPRPPHWGGYRLWARRVELWLGGPGRLHDRAAWSRTLTPVGDSFTPSTWTATRLQP